MAKKARWFKSLSMAVALFVSAGTTAHAAGAALTAPAPAQAPGASPNLWAPSDRVSDQKVWLDAAQGDVAVRKSGAADFAVVNSRIQLSAGDQLRTVKGSCLLRFENNTELTIGPDTVLHVTEVLRDEAKKTRSTLLSLESGKLKAKIGKLERGSRFEITTPTAVAAVRGTVLFLGVGSGQAGGYTDIYVDETQGGVMFVNPATGNAFLVNAFSASSSFGDGGLLAPRMLSSEERESFLNNWSQAASESALQQFGEEESGGEDEEGDEEEEGSDADQDKKSEQNVSGTAAQDALNKLIARYFQNLGTIGSLSFGVERLLMDFQESIPDETVTPRQTLLRSAGLSELINTECGPAEWSYESVAYDAESPAGSAGDLGVVADTFDATPEEDGGETFSLQEEENPYLIDRLAIEEDLREMGEWDPLAELLDKNIDLEALLEDLDEAFIAAVFQLNNDAFVNTAQVLAKRFNMGLDEALEILEQYETLLDHAAKIELMREAERREIRSEIARIRQDQDFDRADANLARISDKQTGKVFVDIHGNRVRVDQYIFHENGDDAVRFLSLTLRKGEYQPGVSAVEVGVQFNQAIQRDDEGNVVGFEDHGVNRIKDLPWVDYFNVVTEEEMQDVLDASPGFEQYIVHETNPGLAYGEGGYGEGNYLYPTRFFAQFTNPARDGGEGQVQDVVRFEETYGEPFALEYYGGDEEEYSDVIVQGRTSDTTFIAPAGGDTVEWTNELVYVEDGYEGWWNEQTSLRINGESVENFEIYSDDGDRDGDQFQSEGFAGYINGSPENRQLLQSADFVNQDHYGQVGEGEDGEPIYDEVEPAHFEDKIVVYDECWNEVANHVLIGLFVPFDNQGNVIDAPGFRVEGLRDLLSPNPLVNGGNYNLEVLFLYGQDVQQEVFDGESSYDEEVFQESFRIDTIITPEIFLDFSRVTPEANEGRLFPATLDTKDDGCYIE